MVCISRTVEGGRSFKNTPPSISDWMMLRFTSSARLGWGLNIHCQATRVLSFWRVHKSTLGRGLRAAKHVPLEAIGKERVAETLKLPFKTWAFQPCHLTKPNKTKLVTAEQAKVAEELQCFKNSRLGVLGAENCLLPAHGKPVDPDRR